MHQVAERAALGAESWREGGCEGVRLRECGRVQGALWLELERSGSAGSSPWLLSRYTYTGTRTTRTYLY